MSQSWGLSGGGEIGIHTETTDDQNGRLIGVGHDGTRTLRGANSAEKEGLEEARKEGGGKGKKERGSKCEKGLLGANLPHGGPLSAIARKFGKIAKALGLTPPPF